MAAAFFSYYSSVMYFVSSQEIRRMFSLNSRERLISFSTSIDILKIAYPCYTSLRVITV